MELLKLVVGKTYICAMGHLVKIDGYEDGYYISDDDIPYNEDGTVFISGRTMTDHRLCLVSEVKKHKEDNELTYEEAQKAKSITSTQSSNKVKNKASTHYEVWEGVEAIDIIKQTLSPEEYKGFLKGNILKYQLRLGKKDDIQKEIIKITDYSNELKKLQKIN